MRPPFSGKPSPLGGPHYPLSIGEWLLPLISLGSDRGQPQVKALPIAKSLVRSSARAPTPHLETENPPMECLVQGRGCGLLELGGV